MQKSLVRKVLFFMGGCSWLICYNQNTRQYTIPRRISKQLVKFNLENEDNATCLCMLKKMLLINSITMYDKLFNKQIRTYTYLSKYHMFFV